MRKKKILPMWDWKLRNEEEEQEEQEDQEQEDKNKRIRPREQAGGQKMTYVFFQRPIKSVEGLKNPI